jgi:peptide chain release factor 1
VPPTEKRGRRQTSTITVAVLPEPQQHDLILDDRDLVYTTRRGSGPGGQHRNKTESTVDLLYKPMNLMVTVDGRKQHQNKQAALQLIRAKILDKKQRDSNLKRNQRRRDQIGAADRANKRRTIRVHDDLVVDHVLNKQISYKQYSRGIFQWVD